MSIAINSRATWWPPAIKLLSVWTLLLCKPQNIWVRDIVLRLKSYKPYVCVYVCRLWKVRNVAARWYNIAFLCVCVAQNAVPLSPQRPVYNRKQMLQSHWVPYPPLSSPILSPFLPLYLSLPHTFTYRLLFLLFFRKDDNRWQASKSPFFLSVHPKMERFSEIRMSTFKCSEKWASPWQILL